MKFLLLLLLLVLVFRWVGRLLTLPASSRYQGIRPSEKDISDRSKIVDDSKS